MRSVKIFFRAAAGVAGLILLAGPAVAADHWLAVEGKNCKAWSERPLQPGELIRWSGGCEDGRLAGRGVLEVTASGQRQLLFEGTMRGGKAEGEALRRQAEAAWKGLPETVTAR